jgi:hypothetical protein
MFSRGAIPRQFFQICFRSPIKWEGPVRAASGVRSADLIQKPLSSEELAALVRTILDA